MRLWGAICISLRELFIRRKKFYVIIFRKDSVEGPIDDYEKLNYKKRKSETDVKTLKKRQTVQKKRGNA